MKATDASPFLRQLLLFLFTAALAAAALLLLGSRLGSVPPVGALLDPWEGLYRTARRSLPPARAELHLPALGAEVTVVRDTRGVPHIFAASDRDAVIAMGYVVAQDRLFQLDFIPRVASGRLSEALGAEMIDTDRFLRSTGMEWGAQRNLARIRAAGGREMEALEWFAAGVNAYLDELDESDLPVEFRLLGYGPDRYAPIQSLRLLQYMTYDLTYGSDDPAYTRLRALLGGEEYERLYPRHNALSVPIVSSSAGGTEGPEVGSPADTLGAAPAGAMTGSAAGAVDARGRRIAGGVAEGFIPGKGSNNWAVDGAHSTTGAPILAGDMHLGLTLPAIWYEVHLVTPTMNVYGVTAPGAPLPVMAFNERLAWAFTNTGADVLDHYALRLDQEKTHYWFQGAWRPLELVPDTVRVRGGEVVVDTMRFAHWGPVQMRGEEAVAIRWIAHEPSRTLYALWEMNHARSYEEFEAALRFWNAPAQNILVATREGTIAIRSTGDLPIRASGSGAGLLDGSTSAHAWVGYVPFEELPHEILPERGFLTSTNQEPADSTYPYYLGHDWRAAYRSLRIDTLLRSRERHGVEDLQQYQSDVHVVQRDLFVPLLDSLAGLSSRAARVRDVLRAWDGVASVDRTEPVVLERFLEILTDLAWDEEVFARVAGGGQRARGRHHFPYPSETQLYLLLRDEPESRWLDRRETPVRETGPALLAAALEATADSLDAEFGREVQAYRWGRHRRVLFRHLLRSDALRPFWRGPYEYGGFEGTLSPAADSITTHSASWRVVVDLSTSPPRAFGVYPGGQSGNPFSPWYDLHLPVYVAHRYYELLLPERPEALAAGQRHGTLTLHP